MLINISVFTKLVTHLKMSTDFEQAFKKIAQELKRSDIVHSWALISTSLIKNKDSENKVRILAVDDDFVQIEDLKLIQHSLSAPFVKVADNCSAIVLGHYREQQILLVIENKQSIYDHSYDLFSAICTQYLKNKEEWRLLEKEKLHIYIDDISGLFNHRKLYQDLDHYIQIYNELKIPFSLLFIDIDFFKNINDQHGHLIGTKMLKDLSQVVSRTVRQFDICYRYGGDEFVVLLPKCNIGDARKIGERVLRNIKENVFSADNVLIKLSVSIGVSSFPDSGMDKREIIRIADAMMYHAKKNGRGMVVDASEMLK